MDTFTVTVFKHYLMDHLGLVDMLGLQYTSRRVKDMVVATRQCFLVRLHREVKMRLAEWSSWNVIVDYLLVESHIQENKFVYGFFTGSIISKLVNRECWPPSHQDIIEFNTGDKFFPRFQHLP
jgi:hypothetical protein